MITANAPAEHQQNVPPEHIPFYYFFPVTKYLNCSASIPKLLRTHFTDFSTFMLVL